MAHIQQTWNTFGPFSAETTTIATAKAILKKGRDQHISFYLEAIKEQQLKFKQQEK